MNDKWTMFKNYMHNEIHITKDDIKVWIKEAVQEEAEKLISQSFGKYDLTQIMKDLVKEQAFNSYSKTFNLSVKQQVAEIIAEQIDIKLKDTEND